MRLTTNKQQKKQLANASLCAMFDVYAQRRYIMNEVIKKNPAEVLMNAFNAACKELGLDTTEKSEVLGVNRTTLTRNNTKGFLPNSKTGEIQLNFIRIYRSLYAIAGGDSEFMRHWFKTHNKGLNGVPTELCKKLEGVFRVNQYLDAMRGKV
jgi:hypothetical protein